jgi:hypothetical protein
MWEVELLNLMDAIRRNRKVPWDFNSTFISLIPKKDNFESFDDFEPFSLCNYIYKIISKVIAIRVKNISLELISFE